MKITDTTNLPTKADLNAKVTDIENKKTNTTNFINTQNLLITKIGFDANMREELKILASKTEVKLH